MESLYRLNLTSRSVCLASFFRFSFQAVMLKQRELQLKAARSKNLVLIIPGMLHHKHLGWRLYNRFYFHIYKNNKSPALLYYYILKSCLLSSVWYWTRYPLLCQANLDPLWQAIANCGIGLSRLTGCINTVSLHIIKTMNLSPHLTETYVVLLVVWLSLECLV